MDFIFSTSNPSAGVNIIEPPADLILSIINSKKWDEPVTSRFLVLIVSVLVMLFELIVSVLIVPVLAMVFELIVLMLAVVPLIVVMLAESPVKVFDFTSPVFTIVLDCNLVTRARGVSILVVALKIGDTDLPLEKTVSALLLFSSSVPLPTSNNAPSFNMLK